MTAPVFESPAACERAFYAAFEACDLEAMMAVWSTDAPVLCVHPAGSPLTDRDAVEHSWRLIFQSGGRVRFSLTDLRVVEDATVSVRYVHENIHHGPGLRAMAVVLASNVYVREGKGWRMCMHHASPGPATDAAREGGDSALH